MGPVIIATNDGAGGRVVIAEKRVDLLFLSHLPTLIKTLGFAPREAFLVPIFLTKDVLLVPPSPLLAHDETRISFDAVPSYERGTAGPKGQTSSDSRRLCTF